MTQHAPETPKNIETHQESMPQRAIGATAAREAATNTPDLSESTIANSPKAKAGSHILSLIGKTRVTAIPPRFRQK